MDAIFAALRIVPFAAFGVSEKRPPETHRCEETKKLHYPAVVLAIEPSNKPPLEEASTGAGGSWYFARTRTCQKSGALYQ